MTVNYPYVSITEVNVVDESNKLKSIEVEGMDGFKKAKDGHYIVTWEDIFRDFQQRFPTLRKRVISWKPSSFGTIELRLLDDECMTYNFDTKHAEFIPEPKIKVTAEQAKKIRERLGGIDE